MSHYSNLTMSKPPKVIYCARCNEPFSKDESMACTDQDVYWHLRCFVCAQCFKPFNSNHEYYDHCGKKYCEYDFRKLFAPCCASCGHCIVAGRFIKAMSKFWHPNCFQCSRCRIPLADIGFIKYKNKALCYECNVEEKSALKDRHYCYKCNMYLEQNEVPLRYKDETYHPYHFNCHACGIELTPDARQIDQDLYCLRCHDKMDIPVCGGCHKPIEERIVTALGRHWHTDHFVCACCEKPFLGKRHYEVRGMAYCEQHYLQLFGYQCEVCEQVITGNVVCALNNYYCVEHFACNLCSRQLVANKTKFFDVYSKPCCKKCYKRLPGKLRKQLAKQRSQRSTLKLK